MNLMYGVRNIMIIEVWVWRK